MSAVAQGLRNVLRNRVRTGIAALVLAIVIGFFALMVQGAMATRQQLEVLHANVRTTIELREAGAFGTGGFGGDKPAGAEHFSTAILDDIRRLPSARHIVRIEEYVHTPQTDPSKPNAYAMIIGLQPGAPLRAIGEVDYENARVIVGRGLDAYDEGRNVTVVGKLYARERLGLAVSGDALSPAAANLALQGVLLKVVGIYTTGNDFGDNHAFIPLETFRRLFAPGAKLSKIRVTVDSIAHVESVAEELKRLRGVDVVTAPEQVATAKATLGSIAAAAFYGSLLIFAAGGTLTAFVMALATRERIQEIGTLKAIGASNAAVVTQILTEVLALMSLAATGAVLLVVFAGPVLASALTVRLEFNGLSFFLIAVVALAFAAIGSLYPVVLSVRLSPVDAMRSL